MYFSFCKIDIVDFFVPSSRIILISLSVYHRDLHGQKCTRNIRAILGYNCIHMWRTSGYAPCTLALQQMEDKNNCKNDLMCCYLFLVLVLYVQRLPMFNHCNINSQVLILLWNVKFDTGIRLCVTLLHGIDPLNKC